MKEEIKKLIRQQRAYYDSGATRNLHFRQSQLMKLKSAILKYEPQLVQAMYKDLGKSEHEVVTTEIGMIMTEIKVAIKNLKKWERRRFVPTNLINIPGRSFILREPYGSTLIIGPWNYPFQLTMSPLIGAICGGNTAIIKPSELSPHTSHVIRKLIAETFGSQYITTVLGGVPETELLLDHRFDMIFFTGSPGVGKIIMEKAAKHLSRVVLELGGKSPCIIDESANMDVAVRRIVFGKATNVGQTCVAPDYLIIHESQFRSFVHKFEETVTKFYGEALLENDHYGTIINKRHYRRIKDYLDDGEIVYGGQYDDDKNKIALTLMKVDSLEKPVMKEEIFGPILPIITYKHEEEIYEIIKENPDPLALYLFSSNQERVQRILYRVPFGGGCINDTIMHLTNEKLPFGGRGSSGHGNYHGKRSYETFTHEKSVYHNGTFFDLPLKYPPFNKKRLSLIKKIMY